MLANSFLFHLAHGKMHPCQCNTNQSKQHHEAACPNAGQIANGTKDNRQNESAETADHTNHAADRADMTRIIDRNVLVDGGLAQRHEEAKHENCDNKGYQTHRCREPDVTINAVDYVIRCGIGEHEKAKKRYAKSGIHDLTRAISIRKNAAIGTKQARRQREGCCQYAGYFDIETIDAHQIFGQPESQRDKGTEDEEIVEREAPDLLVPEWFELLLQGFGFVTGNLARGKIGIVLREQEEGNCGDTEHQRPDLCDSRPAQRNHDKGRGKFRDRCPDIAHTKKAESRSLLFLRIPFGDIGNADRKTAAGKAQTKRRNQCQEISVGIG